MNSKSGRNEIERDLNPAYVLHALREGNLKTEEQLYSHFGLGDLTISVWQQDALLSDRGKLTLDNILEELKSAGLIAVDQDGNLQVSFRLRHLQKALRFSLRQLSHRFTSEQHPQAIQLRKTMQEIKSRPKEPVYQDLGNTLVEVHTCFVNQSRLGAIILSGRVLEICLKHALNEREIDYQDNWTLGRLIGHLRESAPELKLETSHGRIFDIVTQCRNAAVHPGERNFAPGDGEVNLVMAAMLAVVEKLVL